MLQLSHTHNNLLHVGSVYPGTTVVYMTHSCALLELLICLTELLGCATRIIPWFA